VQFAPARLAIPQMMIPQLVSLNLCHGRVTLLIPQIDSNLPNIAIAAGLVLYRAKELGRNLKFIKLAKKR
jgi:hypothetical protein